jgi:hypothetical protein
LMFVCSLPPPLPFSFNLHRHACFACLRSDGVSHIPNCCCLAPCRRSIWKCSSFHFRTYSDMGSWIFQRVLIFFLLLSISLGSCVIFYRFCLLCLPWIIALLLV